jgi:hypothetical protein
MVPRESLVDAPSAPDADLNRERFHAHNLRTVRRAEQQAAVLAARKQAAQQCT